MPSIKVTPDKKSNNPTFAIRWRSSVRESILAWEILRVHRQAAFVLASRPLCLQMDARKVENQAEQRAAESIKISCFAGDIYICCWTWHVHPRPSQAKSIPIRILDNFIDIDARRSHMQLYANPDGDGKRDPHGRDLWNLDEGCGFTGLESTWAKVADAMVSAQERSQLPFLLWVADIYNLTFLFAIEAVVEVNLSQLLTFHLSHAAWDNENELSHRYRLQDLRSRK